MEVLWYIGVFTRLSCWEHGFESHHRHVKIIQHASKDSAFENAYHTHRSLSLRGKFNWCTNVIHYLKHFWEFMNAPKGKHKLIWMIFCCACLSVIKCLSSNNSLVSQMHFIINAYELKRYSKAFPYIFRYCNNYIVVSFVWPGQAYTYTCTICLNRFN